MNNEFTLMTYYKKYLEEVRRVSNSTVKHYIDALNNISRFLIKNSIIVNSIYEIEDLEELEFIKAYLYNNPEFIAQDKRGHQMYSSSLNNYYKFALGEGFNNKRKKLDILDIEIAAKDKILNENFSWKRSNIIKTQCLEMARYMCEIDLNHHTFISENTKHQFMEGHHVIPICKQEYFVNSLDIYANIVCLCPICHRKIHFGVQDEKKKMMNKIYAERIGRLVKSGIKVSKNEFFEIAM